MSTNDQTRAILNTIKASRPCLWINPGLLTAEKALESLELSRSDMMAAQKRLQRFAPVFAKLFPETAESKGIIESGLIGPLDKEQALHGLNGTVFIKADHNLPVAGSIKARGGIYAVLCEAERIGLETSLIHDTSDDYLKLISPDAAEVFSQYNILVGSTGNLGLSIGIMGSALGFRVSVHMSVEAKKWKKERLRKRGVHVVEHASDYTAACTRAREEATSDPCKIFIDDENSAELFLGYSTAALRLVHQLEERNICISDQRPLIVYLPCGVGGAPGGITFGLKHVFGDYVYCFFAEPVQAPCMTIGLITGKHDAVSVYDLGLHLHTDADGLAVSRPSRFVGRLVSSLISGCFTVNDSTLYRLLLESYSNWNLEMEPSSCAGLAGPEMLSKHSAGTEFLNHLTKTHPVHLLWTTGGSFVPSEEHKHYRSIAISKTANSVSQT